MAQVLRRDRDWAPIDGEICEVIKFRPFAKVVDGEVYAPDRTMPYALIDLACREKGIELPEGTTGVVSHQMDFKHLWAAFNDRGVSQNEKVFVVWSKRKIRGVARIFSSFMPRLAVLIFKDDAYELLHDNNYRPELRGAARWEASRPVLHLQPEIWN